MPGDPPATSPPDHVPSDHAPSTAPIVVQVLGPIRVLVDDREVVLRARERAVVAALALARGRPSSTHDLVDVLWEAPPPTAPKTVHNHVRRIRGQVPDLIVTRGRDYHLGPTTTVDAHRFVEVARAAVEGQLTGPLPVRAAALDDAAARWRGLPYAELADSPAVERERDRLVELRHIVDEELAACLLAAGQPRAAALRLEDLARSEPYRERRWSLLVLARYRNGRRRDALRAVHEARAALGRAGLEPGDDLQRLEALVLADDPALLTGHALSTPALTAPGHPTAWPELVGPHRVATTAAPGPAGGTMTTDDTATSPLPPPPRPFVGRRHELDRVATACDRAVSQRQAALALVVAEAGMGKTTLADRLAADLAAQGQVVLRAACEQTPAGPLAPLAQLVRALVEVHGVARVSAWAGPDLATVVRLAPGAGLDTGPRSASADANASPAAVAAVALVAQAARAATTTCLVDDIHWAPPSTARALRALAQVAAPLTLVALARPEGQEVLLAGVGADVEVVRMGELEHDEVAAYVRGVLGSDADDASVEAVWARGAGHPLLTTELVASMAASRSSGPGSSGAGLPADLADALVRRLAGLAADTRSVLQAASVLGSSFDVAVLQQVVGAPCARALAEGAEAGVIEPQPLGRYRFRHELTRDLLYDTTPLGTRVELHEVAGLALATSGATPATEVAHHLVQAADLDPRRAARAARAAGEEATALFAHEEAAAHHAREAELVERAGGDADPDLGPALARWGESLRMCGGMGSVDILLRAAAVARRAGDGDVLARATWSLCQLGATTEVGPPAPELDALVDEALAQVRDPALAASLGAAASLLYSLSGTSRCRPLYEEAERRARTEAPAARRAVLPFAYLALGDPDDLARRAELADELEALALAHEDPVARFEALHLRFSARLAAGHPGLVDLHREMAALARRVGDPGRRWTVCYQQATLHHLAGDLAAAERASEEGLEDLADGVAPSRRLAVHGAQLLAVRADQGRLAELVDLVADLVAGQGSVPAWRAVLAAALAAAGRPDEARAELVDLARDRYASLPRDVTWSAALVVAARTAARVGSAELVEDTYELLAPLTGRMSWTGTCTFGPVDEALGALLAAAGRADQAVAHYERAVAVARSVGAPAMAERSARRSEALTPSEAPAAGKARP